MKTKILAILALGALGLSAAVPAQAMPATPLQQAATPSDVVQVYHRGRSHKRARIRVYPAYRYAEPGYGYGPGYGARLHYDDMSQYPYSRGFEDRNPARRGNIRGCSVDLGYGRYESCDQ